MGFNFWMQEFLFLGVVNRRSGFMATIAVLHTLKLVHQGMENDNFLGKRKFGYVLTVLTPGVGSQIYMYR